MIYLDTPFTVSMDHPTAPRCFKGKQAAHLMADSEDELIAYATLIGMKREWIQYPGTAYAHFDLTGAKLKRAMQDGRVKQITAREMAVMIQKRKAAQC